MILVRPESIILSNNTNTYFVFSDSLSADPVMKQSPTDPAASHANKPGQNNILIVAMKITSLIFLLLCFC